MADGVFYAELNELLTRELAENGYSGVEVRVTPMRTEIIIKATRTQDVLGGWSRKPSCSMESMGWQHGVGAIGLCSRSVWAQEAAGSA